MTTEAKPKKYTASQVATLVPLLEARIEELEREVKALSFQSSRQDGWIQLLLTSLLSTMRWAYAWCKVQRDQKRMDNFKLLGTSLGNALEEIEPDF